MSPARLSARGFSLIESMAALLVFTIGILGVMQMNVIASQQNNVARSHTTASKLARDLADAFERLPFNHPVFLRTTGLQPNVPAFTDFNNGDGLYTLAEATAVAGARPLLGASDAIMMSEGGGTMYQVAWRVQDTPDPDVPGTFASRRIAIMVRYPTPAGFRQVTVWAIKYNPASVTLGTAANAGMLEI